MSRRHQSYTLMCCWDELCLCGGTHTRRDLQKTLFCSLCMTALGKQGQDLHCPCSTQMCLTSQLYRELLCVLEIASTETQDYTGSEFNST